MESVWKAENVSRESFRTRTAYHEAGHAVAAVLLGIGVSSITIVPDVREMSSGMTEYRDTLDTTDTDRVDRYAVAFLAGPVAEARFTPEPIDWEAKDDYIDAVGCVAGITDRMTLVWGDPTDLREAIERAGAEERMRGLVELAEGLVEKHWTQVETVAHALLEANTLEGDEAERLIDHA